MKSVGRIFLRTLAVTAGILAAVLIVVAIASFIMGYVEGKTGATGEQKSLTAKLDSLTAQTVFEAVNNERGQVDVQALGWSSQLASSAAAKCNDMAVRDYWDHNDPDGAEPWHFITDTGYVYALAGENLAIDYSSTEALVNGWIDSPSHRDTMLNPEYVESGVAICKDRGGRTMIVQHFAQP